MSYLVIICPKQIAQIQYINLQEGMYSHYLHNSQDKLDCSVTATANVSPGRPKSVYMGQHNP